MTAQSKINTHERLVRRRLLSWYRRNKRDLPWRDTRDPYRIWVSEIMLQQTQVSTVIPYYVRFIRKFPTVRALARARLQTVLKHWEGLGYYSRARNFHRAAVLVVRQSRGRIPKNLERLEALPGVGRSTAGAIASIAFGRSAPILDGNVKRVLCRLFAVTDDPKRPEVKNRLWERSARLLPSGDPGSFNQALMDLGATVCLPRNPDCGKCPVDSACRARQLRIQDRIPVRSKSRPVPNRRMAVAVILNGDRLLSGPRPEEGLLAGLWGLPETIDLKGHGRESSLQRAFMKTTGLELTTVGRLRPVVHAYTHLRVTYLPLVYSCTRTRPVPPWQWIRSSRIGILPFSTATRRIFSQVASLSGRSDRPSLAAEDASAYAPRPVETPRSEMV
jgi:A/G-specific adenine glycosylase